MKKCALINPTLKISRDRDERAFHFEQGIFNVDLFFIT